MTDEAGHFAASLRQVVSRGGDLDAALLDVGWHDALALDPALAVPSLFTALGVAGGACGALGHVLAAGLGASDPVLLPALGTATPPGSVAAGQVRVRGLATPAEHWCIAVGGATVRLAAADLTVREVQGLDPTAGLVVVEGAAPAGPLTAGDRWSAAVRLGRLALAHQLLGGSRAMLDLARTHALDRVQFGRPIAGFQAVRHRLADALVTVEAAESALTAAWEGDEAEAAMAKALAGRAARTTARHCQQVLAGIGFTTEHPLHRHVRRTWLLDPLLGSATTLTRELGEHLLASRQLPPLVAL